jgi:hypothetical protein
VSARRFGSAVQAVMASRGVQLSDDQAAAFAADLLALSRLGCLVPLGDPQSEATRSLGRVPCPEPGPRPVQSTGTGRAGEDTGASNTVSSVYIAKESEPC